MSETSTAFSRQTAYFHGLDGERLTTLQTYLILNQSAASRCQLSRFLQRSGWVRIGLVGAYTEETLSLIKTGNYTPIFLRLSDPEEFIPVNFLSALRQHPAVIVTSPYPQHLFGPLELKPFDFLTEPYSFERFSACINRYSSQFI